MIIYTIDTTENGYNTLTGEAATVAELRDILTKNGGIADCMGSLNFGAEDASITICADKQLGFYVAVIDEEDVHLSVGDEGLLDEVVDVWGDDLEISKGLFISAELAWQAIEEYISSRKLSNKVDWITPDDLPEDGNYIEL